jgi:hypothetical protein
MDMLISINLRHPQADSLDLFQAKRLPELKILSKSRLKLYYIYIDILHVMINIF